MGGVGGTITLSEASRFGHSTAFSLMLKPVGSRCNLRCSYCYYLDKASLYGGARAGDGCQAAGKVHKRFLCILRSA